METVRSRPKTSWTWLLFITVLAGVFGWYSVFTAREITLRYDSIDKLSKTITETETKLVELPLNEDPLVIPGFQLFSNSQPWMYISSASPVSSEFTPNDLVEVDLPHGDNDEVIKLENRTVEQLKKLFDRAAEDRVELMISSAYRSVADQTKLYDAFVAKQGQAAASQYVAKPRMSEHHSGFAVDITDASSACLVNSDSCNLSPATAAWLADTAPEYGFIIRYPSGKQPITGTAYEPWHLRYVGVALAKQLSTSNLTLDEFIEQVAPGKLTSTVQR